ncbi:ATP-binding cassette domain-containing protein [Sporolactobacillus sp. Y61]|uniref:ATP-binding cassette domain-containing protein n=1 Tax=Sporolactobacillus sp. Y61 TaxID=3160863 RepID=A0AAU8ICH7_9BACL
MKITHLSYHYPKSKKNLFHDLSMEILPGRMNILIGMNGEGKTTLFDILAGLIDTDAQIEHPVPAHEVLYQIQGVPVLSTIRGKIWLN